MERIPFSPRVGAEGKAQVGLQIAEATEQSEGEAPAVNHHV
jgi:hypothetical protein